MSNTSQTHKTVAEAGSGTLVSYSLGFLLSIVLTLVAYFLVVNDVFVGWTLMVAIILLAMVQLLVQLVFFLHLGRESKPRWNLIMFLFMLMVVVIVGLGSLWIMHNLDSHMMSPKDANDYMQHESQKGF